MIDPQSFYKLLRSENCTFYAGVPDSLLKDFGAYIAEHADPQDHVITANEGAAVALAAGVHLATRTLPVVYMQNSGIGNAVNPLLSLADPDVYSIPMLVIVGWRGEPGVKDEPQHVKQGRIQEELIRTLGYRYEILSADFPKAEEQIRSLTTHAREQGTPVVLLVRKGTFRSYSYTPAASESGLLSREDALNMILDALSPEDRVVSTTGKTSREVYEYRDRNGHGHDRDFLTVGSMGHAVMIALGVSRFSSRSVYCIDGDGAHLMHLGSMPIAALEGSENFRHIVINNGAHESVGGQPTVGFQVPFHEITLQCGYRASWVASTSEEIVSALTEMGTTDGPAFLEIRVRQGSRPDLGRPKTTPRENKAAFMEQL